MKKKILGIFVCTLLIAATGLSVAGSFNLEKKTSTLEIIQPSVDATNRITNNQADLLIIAHEDFCSALKALQIHKNATGIKTIIRSWQSFDIEYQNIGRDEPERIKLAIADYEHDYNIKWVMLVGDCDKFPVRYVSSLEEEPRTYLPCDLYYADLYKFDGTFNNWDDDGDGVYAELRVQSPKNNVDKVNWHPDVSVGRVPASNLAEVYTYMYKVRIYEQSNKSQWFKEALLVGGDWEPGIDTKENIANNYLSGFTIHKLYHNGTHGQPHPTPTLINSFVNNGVGFLNYYGHATLVEWATHNPPPTYYHVDNLSDLNNPTKLTIVFSSGCSNGGYAPCPPWGNYTDIYGYFHPGQTPNGTTVPPAPIQPTTPHNCDQEAMPEHWLVYSNDGAIAYLASVATTNPGYPGILDKYFFEAYENGIRTFGEMWRYMIEEYLYELFDWKGNAKRPTEWHRRASWNQLIMFHPFGDPSLRVGNGGLPFIKIELNKGFSFGVRAVIKNEGQSSATNIDWTIKVHGGFFGWIDEERHGTIPSLGPLESKGIAMGMLFGLGPILITVVAGGNVEVSDGIQWFLVTQII
ncbi:MAG: hypothetical protein JSW60_08090 [Thermoplasmatales archaeon]|nr:MAG: hypothetical protein JSW60_08090 [Thermoplasmatales archaeon]